MRVSRITPKKGVLNEKDISKNSSNHAAHHGLEHGNQ